MRMSKIDRGRSSLVVSKKKHQGVRACVCACVRENIKRLGTIHSSASVPQGLRFGHGLGEPGHLIGHGFYLVFHIANGIRGAAQAMC